MDHHDFNKQLDRLAVYFRHGKPLTNNQKDEWWERFQRADLEDFTRAVDALIDDGRLGQMPTLRQAQAATWSFRAARRRDQETITTMATVPTNDEFSAGCRRNVLRLMGHIFINSAGDIVKVNEKQPLPEGVIRKPKLTYEQGVQNLYALADKHEVDPSRWPYLPTHDADENRRLFKIVGKARAHAAFPSNIPAPADLKDLNRGWLENVFQPEVMQNIERGR